jgi:hypothetical protein
VVERLPRRCGGAVMAPCRQGRIVQGLMPGKLSMPPLSMTAPVYRLQVLVAYNHLGI